MRRRLIQRRRGRAGALRPGAGARPLPRLLRLHPQPRRARRSRVADAGIRLMEQIVSERGGLPPSRRRSWSGSPPAKACGTAAPRTSSSRASSPGLADREQKLALLNCLFAVSAVDRIDSDRRRQRDPPDRQRAEARALRLHRGAVGACGAPAGAEERDDVEPLRRNGYASCASRPSGTASPSDPEPLRPPGLAGM